MQEKTAQAIMVGKSTNSGGNSDEGESTSRHLTFSNQYLGSITKHFFKSTSSIYDTY